MGRCAVIPPEFEYAAPESLENALRALADGGEDAKVLAGGHSLLPLMKLRLAAPSLLVDLRKVPGLRGVQREDGSFRVGAMTRHADLQSNAALGTTAGTTSVTSGAAIQVDGSALTIAEPVTLNGTVVPRSPSHSNGWDYHPDAMTITFFGSYCAQITSGSIANVSFVYGCPGPVIE